MNKNQLLAARRSLSETTDEMHSIALRTANAQNKSINLAAYSVGVMLIKALDAALAVTPGTEKEGGDA